MTVLDLIRRKSQPRIFICYRRQGEGSGYGGRLADKLVKHFGPGQCFRDVENIETGVDFVDSITKAIDDCEVLVVVIGPDWATQRDEQKMPRINDPKDFVRLEVAAALRRNIRVMPVLVGGAEPPDEDQLPEDLRDLPRRQAHELSDSRWDYDTDRLIHAIESIGIKGRSPAGREALKQKIKLGAAVLVTFAVVLLGMLVVWTDTSPPGDESYTTAQEDVQQDRTDTEEVTAKTEKARPPAATIPNIAGIWRDRNNSNNGSQFTQNGNSIDFRRWGVLPNGIQFESQGSGTITATKVTSYYNATYGTGFTSTGDCSGTVSADGMRMDLICSDSVLGAFPVTAIRQ